MRTVIFMLCVLAVVALGVTVQQGAVYAQDRCQTPGPTPERQQQIRNQLNQWIQSGGRTISAITTIPVAFYTADLPGYDLGFARFPDEFPENNS